MAEKATQEKQKHPEVVRAGQVGKQGWARWWDGRRCNQKQLDTVVERGCVRWNGMGKVGSWICFEGRESYRACGKINLGCKRKKSQECRQSNRKIGGAIAGSKEGCGGIRVLR